MQMTDGRSFIDGKTRLASVAMLRYKTTNNQLHHCVEPDKKRFFFSSQMPVKYKIMCDLSLIKVKYPTIMNVYTYLALIILV